MQLLLNTVLGIVVLVPTCIVASLWHCHCWPWNIELPTAHPLPFLTLRPEGYVSPFEKFCVALGGMAAAALRRRRKTIR
jgi:hypothetical protein